jgi:hypothetical protein
VPNLISESFTLSLLSAVMRKLVLELVVVVKGWIKARLLAATTPAGRTQTVAGGDA